LTGRLERPYHGGEVGFDSLEGAAMSGRLARCVLAAGLLALPHPLLAQTTGSIRGEVADSANVHLAGAVVTLTGEPIRGAERTAVTGATGTFLFTGLPTGLYTLRAELGGYAPLELKDVRVQINTTTSVPFVLAPMEAIQEVMTVTSEAPLISLTGSQVGNNYSADFIEDLPTGRNMWDLVSVSPGMSQTTQYGDRQVAFGSNIQSNSWNVDGLDVSAPETGSAWWYINPDTIAEIQVLGIGAPAEFGNMMGAAFNIVTKSGTNDFEGGFNAFYQADSLTDDNVTLGDADHPHFTRTKYHDLTLTAGGPIKQNRAWYFASAETLRDAIAIPGVDPDFAPENRADRFDAKLDLSITPSHQLSAKYHYEDWALPESGSAFVAPSAAGFESGTNPAWGLGLTSVLGSKNLFEFHYAGWWSDDFWRSQTGSTEPPFVDYSPPGGGPPVYSGGVLFPFDYVTYLHQFNAKLSHFADDFIQGDHDFKFGVQYSYGSAETDIFAGLGGSYYYHYVYEGYYGSYSNYYKYTFTPFRYGAKQTAASAFVDDSWQINDRLTLNLGVRYDRQNGRIPSYPRLDDDGDETAVALPEIDDVVDWQNVSPRLGFAWVATADQKTVVRGSFGVYVDGNVSGNWNYPPPGIPPTRIFQLDEETGEYDLLVAEIATDEFAIDPDLEAPRTLQYALGVDRQLGASWAVGAQLVYKDTDNLVGWEVLDDGVYEPFEFVDEETGRVFQLVNIVEFPTVRKGNRPGPGSLAPDEEYHQEYEALLLTAQKRFARGWSLMGSYTYSESTGLIPRMLSDTQFNPFYGSREGADPNNYLNADQLLQGDRKHMFRVQGNFTLPWGLELAGALNVQSGRPYSRQARVPLDQGLTTIIVEPASDDRRLPSTALIDLALGKRITLPHDVVLKLDAQVFNLLNEDSHQFWETLVLAPGDTFVESEWVLPRRVMLRLGVEF
jgi:outer membrane receptor protein involved in Fe transport